MAKMCEQKIRSSGPPLNLDRNEISILKILRSLQTETVECAKNESGTETGRGKSNTCFQFCKHCIAQLDSVIAANPILTSSSSAFCEVIPNSKTSAEIRQYNCNLNSSGSGPCPSPIPSQECSESNNKLLMFLKLVSSALSLNSLREVETTRNNNASLPTYDIDHNHYTVISSSSISTATSSIPIADQLVTPQIGEETIFGLNSTYCNNYDDMDKIKTAANVKIETCYQLPFATSTSSSSQPEALLDHQYNAYEYDNDTSTYTVEALVPEQQRSYIFPNNITHETDTAITCAPDPGLGNFQFLGPDTTHGDHGRGLVLSYQPNSVLTLELPGLTNIIENVDGKNSNQSCYDAGLPYMGQEVEISLLGQVSQPQFQLPPLSSDYLVPKKKSRKQKLASSIPQQPPKTQNDKSRSVKLKEGERKREKQSKKSIILPLAVSQILPENPHPHSCQSCTSTFPSKYSLNKHRREQHKGFTCQFCYQSYSLAKELREHKLECALKTKKIYSCQICLKEYLSRESVRRHERTHSGIKPHKCDKCGRCYYERYDLVKHRKRYANGVSCVGPDHATNTGNFKFMASNDAVTVVDFYTAPTSTSTSSTIEMAATPSFEATLVQSSSGNPKSQNENNGAVKYFGTIT